MSNREAEETSCPHVDWCNFSEVGKTARPRCYLVIYCHNFNNLSRLSSVLRETRNRVLIYSIHQQLWLERCPFVFCVHDMLSTCTCKHLTMRTSHFCSCSFKLENYFAYFTKRTQKRLKTFSMSSCVYVWNHVTRINKTTFIGGKVPCIRE